MALKTYEKNALTFLMQHLLYGTIGGLLFGFLFLWLDIGGLRTLAMNSDDTGLIIGLLFFGLFVTFGSVGMGVGIMGLGEDKN